jgi:formyltetrahydrofolate hydrolase
MIRTRTSKHNISSITNKGKLASLDMLFLDYKHDLDIYINLIISNELPLKSNLSSALLPNYNIIHSKYKREIYKQASAIVRSEIQLATKRRLSKYKQLYRYLLIKNSLNLILKI